jgi:hypothetical protein
MFSAVVCESENVGLYALDGCASDCHSLLVRRFRLRNFLHLTDVIKKHCLAPIAFLFESSWVSAIYLGLRQVVIESPGMGAGVRPCLFREKRPIAGLFW